MRIFQELEAKHGRITIATWRQACIASRKLSGGDDEESHERAFRRARVKLLQLRVLMIEGDVVMPYTPDFDTDDG